MNSPDYNDYIDMFNVPTPMASPSYEVMYDSLPPMEQSTVSDSSLEDPMEQSRVLESPLKEPVDSKPPVVLKSPDPPVKKVNSVIHRSPRSKEQRKEKRRNLGQRKEEQRNLGQRKEKRRNLELRNNEEKQNEEQLKEKGQNESPQNEKRRNEKRRNDELWNNEEKKKEEQLKQEGQNEELQNEERWNVKRWNYEQRPRYPRFYRRPNFRPRIKGIISNPECIKPPYAQQLMPTSQENAQDSFSTAKVWPCCVLETVVSR
ncbi:hypothetical protein TNCV_4916981 [Trichonephila clavipes]|nr:hypothetical protein TNCV_4916981 [Trichonephila clavipes]